MLHFLHWYDITLSRLYKREGNESNMQINWYSQVAVVFDSGILSYRNPPIITGMRLNLEFDQDIPPSLHMIAMLCVFQVYVR